MRPDIDAPKDWQAAAERIVRERVPRILVLGARDVGKSTFCRFLLDECASAGLGPALLDADVGQKTVGPPASVTLGRPTADGEPALSGLAFVGTTDPVRGWSATLRGIDRLAEKAGRGVLLVNTGGLLAGPGRRLKSAKITALRPDLIVVIGAGPAAGAVLAEHGAMPRLELAPSVAARRKTPAERRESRARAFRDYFRGAATWRVPLNELGGAPAPGPLRTLPARLLVGLGDGEGNDVALGLLLETRSREVTLLTPARRCEVRQLVPGSIVLDEEFRDLRPTLRQR